MLNLRKIGSKISLLRKQKKMKQSELADTLFVTHQAVSKWENGKSIPSIDILYELTRLFKVSIDYLLDDSEILDDDYIALLSNFPRESVISNFLQKSNLDAEIEKIFYLLNKTERKMIIDRIVSKNVIIKIESIWHILSKSERQYLLVIILSKKFKYDISNIFHQLTQQEQNLVLSGKKNGMYTFRLPNRKGVIL
ncbi:helix-turn-helix transcriptional regulator [Mycoplasmatota bacterium WC30]